MEITVNNQLLNIKEGSCLQDVATDQLGDKQKGVAIAVNDTVIPKAEWPNHKLNSKDNILIIKATQGG